MTKIDPYSIVIVPGGAKGVDVMARKLARELGTEIIEIIPYWKTLGRKQES